MIPNLKFQKIVFMSVISFALFACGKGDRSSTGVIHKIKIKDTEDLQGYFKYTANDIFLISGHRGGAEKGYPENCIATFDHVLQHTPATFEIDPRLTKDSVIVLMHDATLDRTTNGTGKLSDYTWEELKKLKLKDPEGNVTEYGIPTLDEVIAWSKGKTVVILDKKDVPLAMTSKKIMEKNAEAHVMITVHTAEEAGFYYRENPKVMFEAFVNTKEALQSYEQAGIPWSHVMAYIGPENKSENKELVDLLHERGVMCMISGAPVYDKLSAPERAIAYQQIISAGVDIIESDRPIEVAEAIRSLQPDASPKNKYFENR